MTGTLKILFFIGDLILLNFSILLSLKLVSPDWIISVNAGSIYLLVFSNLSWLFLVTVSTPYNVTKGMTISKVARSQGAFLFLHLLVVASLILLFKQHYNFQVIIFLYTFFIGGLFMFRLIAFYLRKIFVNEDFNRNYIIIGRNQLSEDIRKFYLVNREEGYKFVRYFDVDVDNFEISGLQEFCQQANIHEIFCCTTNVSDENLRRLLNFGLDSLIKVRFVMTPKDTGEMSIQLSQFDQLRVDVVSIPLDSQLNQVVKRMFDLAFSMIIMSLVMLWLIPLIGIIIKLNSKGPVFFIQLRNGEGNKPFRCLKFRTMVVNTESDTKQASKGDARITSVGKFLRKSSLDELPQFINVLVGDMSIIGPRPHPISLNEKFTIYISKLMSRHYVKPGITGLAQCMGYRGETRDIIDMENRYRLDRYYIENWSFWLDLKIVFLTVVSLIRGSEKAF